MTPADETVPGSPPPAHNGFGIPAGGLVFDTPAPELKAPADAAAQDDTPTVRLTRPSAPDALPDSPTAPPDHLSGLLTTPQSPAEADDLTTSADALPGDLTPRLPPQTAAVTAPVIIPTATLAAATTPATPPQDVSPPQIPVSPADALADDPTVPLPAPQASAAPGVLWQGADIPTQPVAFPGGDPALAWSDTCPGCGGVVDTDGYCTQCGARAPRPRDHYTLAPVSWIGGVCDIGRHHSGNEDALAVAADPEPGSRAVLVVCDGVTTSQDSDVASLAGAKAACRSLWGAGRPAGLGFEASRQAALDQALRQAIREADAAVVAATAPDSANPASATIAIAWILGPVICSANLGDSRVYWFPDEGEPRQLSEDHSLAQAQINEGVARSTAEASALAHTITRWLGRDAGSPEPSLAQFPLTESGWALVCSDGLWNYASSPDDLGAVLAQAAKSDDGLAPSPAVLAERLVAWANEQGGHDNVTAALARCEI
jgi:serine/threonine protein phosphatase PrpC